jgi:hypothetical protein
MKKQYKTIDLFGNETVREFSLNADKKDRALFDDYDAFVDKFEPKKTTDDCYTPTDVYALVLEYVAQNYNLTGKEIVRPFYPNGDYKALQYAENTVVIDNPPFSIISQIARFYTNKGIPFFLFAPHLTLFSIRADCTHIIIGATITYENGAKVNTSFVSNMFGDAKIIGDADLCKKFKELENGKKANLPKYKYPDEVLTVSQIGYIVDKGISIRIDKKHTKNYGVLQAQKALGKAIFGSGFLISKQAAAEKAAAEKAAAEKAAAEKVNAIIWELSAKEWDIVNSLGDAPTASQISKQANLF